MSSQTTDLLLSADFQPGTEEQWRTLVDKVLKGADFEKRLVSRTTDGLTLRPLYMQARDATPVGGRTAGKPWRISQRMDHPQAKEANALALIDLEGGVDSLTIVTPGSNSANGYGVMLPSLEDLETAFNEIALEMIALRIDPSPGGKRTAALLAAYVKNRGLIASNLSINFGLDPISALMRSGALASDWQTVAARLAETAAGLREQGFGGPLLTCDVRLVHEAGGSEAQELAVALASGVAYLRALSDNGHDLEAAARCLSWTIAIDADQFLSIAKLRALRLLWARVEEASGLTPQPIDIHAETAWRMMSRQDPGVNMLRTTMATFAAGIGGADSVSVLPYTQPLGLANAFARRIARNTQTVLLEESNLWRVADPAAGSGAYEALTEQLCETAWAAFQEIEGEGGIVASLISGTLQARISDVRTAREIDVACRKTAITGTSEFPAINEPEETVLEVDRPYDKIPVEARGGKPDMTFAETVDLLAGGTSLADVTPPPASAVQVTALPSPRASEPFETLRDAAAAFAAQNGAPPSVFLANLGPLAEHGTRATWIRNLLAAGGIAGTTNDGFTNSSDVGAAFGESGAHVACLCGADQTYGELAEATASLLKSAGAKRIYLAGRPGDLETNLRSAGVDGFLYAGIDVLAALKELHEVLDVS